jgi:hypothetical protein
MSEHPRQQKKATVQQRLATALRDNLKRRKAQTRGRKEEAKEATKAVNNEETRAKPHDSAGIDADK